MIVTPIDPIPPYPQRIVGPRSLTNSPRSQGTLHLTTVLRDMAETAGIGKDSAEQDDLDWYAAGGWLWERAWDLAHADAIEDGRLVNPGEIECDGIVGTPDRIWTELWRLVELKARWMAAWKFDSLEKYFPVELMQIKSYLHMYGMTEAELHVFFVAGNWRPPVPESRSVLLEFTEREIRDNWESVVRHATKKGWL